jgi:hypothetical protein
LDFFLTTDDKFLRLLREDPSITDLAYRAVTPSELVGILDFTPAELPVGENELVPFSMG